MLSFVALTTILTVLASQAAAANISAVIPSSTSKCIKGYEAGSDTALITLPYPYQEILSIVDSFLKPNQWAIPPNTSVISNGTDNTPGTARQYTLDGVQATETLETYLNPKGGPFQEVYSAAKLTIPTFNLSIYSDYDSVMLSPVCGGRASAFNFTIKMCATNVTEAVGLQHLQHLKGPQALAAALGGANFTSCDALTKSNSTTASTSINTASTTLVGTATTSGTSAASTAASATSAASAAASSAASSLASASASTSATGSSASATATGAAVRYGGVSAVVAGFGALAVAALV